MTRPALSNADFNRYLDALGDHSLHRVSFTMMTLNHRIITSVRPLALDGQVNYHRGAENWDRVLSASFLDPDHALGLDADAPTDGMGGTNRYLQVRHSVFVPALDQWVASHVITAWPGGGVVKRDGDRMVVEAPDKMSRHMRHSTPGSIAGSRYVVVAIRELLELSGETRFRFPSPAQFGARLPKAVPFGGPEDDLMPGRVARRLAAEYGLELFYDGAGWAVLRRPPSGVAMRLREVEMLEPVSTTVDHTRMRNRVRVTAPARVPKGKKPKSIMGFAGLPASHAYSPHTMGVNGKLWQNNEFVELSRVSSKARVDRVAAAILNNKSVQRDDLQITAMPFFHGEPGDLLVVDLGSGERTTRLREASLPLLPTGDGEGMTIGWQKILRNPRVGRSMRRTR